MTRCTKLAATTCTNTNTPAITKGTLDSSSFNPTNKHQTPNNNCYLERPITPDHDGPITIAQPRWPRCSLQSVRASKLQPCTSSVWWPSPACCCFNYIICKCPYRDPERPKFTGRSDGYVHNHSPPPQQPDFHGCFVEQGKVRRLPLVYGWAVLARRRRDRRLLGRGPVG